MTDPLLEATEALRQWGGGRSGQSITRARVLASLEKKNRRANRRAVMVIPLAALLIGSVALAATRGHLPAALQNWLTAHAAAGTKRTNELARTVPHKANHARAAQDPNDAGTSSNSSSTATVDTAVPRERLDVESNGMVRAKPSATRSSVQDAARERSPSDEKPISEEEYERYRVAHDAHFVRRDPRAALEAWSEYLAYSPSGRLAVEARYNRALCLLRLGRNQEAIAALKPFTDGTYGAYRQRDARRLLSTLYPDAG
jgi:tetratricopeptide (TPR) repeat protein